MVKKIEGSMDLTDYLLSSAGVGVVPGNGFGADKQFATIVRYLFDRDSSWIRSD